MECEAPDRKAPNEVSLATGAEVWFVPPPEKYSTLDAGRFCRYESYAKFSRL
jgi:hypothetical protein